MLGFYSRRSGTGIRFFSCMASVTTGSACMGTDNGFSATTTVCSCRTRGLMELVEVKSPAMEIKERYDISRWFNWIEENSHPHCVFGFGESMGAGQLLQSLPSESRFCAVIAESPFETFREVSYARFGRPFHTGPWLGRTFFWPTDEVGFLFVRLAYGLNMDAVSPREAVRQSAVPVFLIHGTADRNIPPYNSEDIQRANPAKVRLWEVRGAAHCGAHEVAPDEFDHKVLDWLSQHSAGNANTSHFD